MTLGQSKYNLASPIDGPDASVSALHNSAVTTSPDRSDVRWHHQNPMTWLLGVGAITLGLIYVTRPGGSVKVAGSAHVG